MHSKSSETNVSHYAQLLYHRQQHSFPYFSQSTFKFLNCQVFRWVPSPPCKERTAKSTMHGKCYFKSGTNYSSIARAVHGA